MHTIKTTLAAALLGLALYYPPTFAATDCMETATSQSAMTGCAHRQYAEADKHLNAQYSELMTTLADEPKEKKLLIKAQRRWIDLRDAECRFNASPAAGGTAQPMVSSLCLADLTAKRSTELDYYLNCSEGDLSCPTWGKNDD